MKTKDKSNYVRVLSLGAGVQSTALAYLFEHGKLENPPDFAVFADTQGEPKAVYKMLDKIKKDIKTFPIIVATKGDLKLNPAKIPFFIKNPETGERGMGGRQCSNDYKIQVVEQTVRKQLGYKKGERWKHRMEVILGMSVDEIQRMKTPLEKYKKNRYPLIDELWWKRHQCIEFCNSLGITPPRSACWFCPYRSDREWMQLKKDDPESWEKACNYDEEIRNKTGFNKDSKYKGEQFIHSGLKPLRNTFLKGSNQPSLFDENMVCEGICGV